MKEHKDLRDKYEALAVKFTEAGKGDEKFTIYSSDLKEIGIKRLPNARSWFEFCDAVYQQITGFPIPECKTESGRVVLGEGRRSRFYGEQVAEALRNELASL